MQGDLIMENSKKTNVNEVKTVEEIVLNSVKYSVEYNEENEKYVEKWKLKPLCLLLEMWQNNV